MFCLIFKHEVLNIYILFVLWCVAIFFLTLVSFFLLQNDRYPIWIPIQSCLRPHLDSTPIVDNSTHIVFLPPYPPSYITPYILPYPPPYLPPYPTSSILSLSSFIILPIPRATTTIHMTLNFSPIITIRLPPFPRLRLPHQLSMKK